MPLVVAMAEPLWMKGLGLHLWCSLLRAQSRGSPKAVGNMAVPTVVEPREEVFIIASFLI